MRLDEAIKVLRNEEKIHREAMLDEQGNVMQIMIGGRQDRVIKAINAVLMALSAYEMAIQHLSDKDEE